MAMTFQGSRDAWRAWYSRRTRVGRWTSWLLLVLAASILGERLPLHLPGLATAAMTLSILGLCIALPILLYRWVTQRMLWKVRSRLILTYLMIGLAPVILFTTLGALAIYLFAGQYSTTSVLTTLDHSTAEVMEETIGEASAVNSTGTGPGGAERRRGTGSLPTTQLTVDVLSGSTWKPLGSSAGANAKPMAFSGASAPAWLQPPFRGIVEKGGQLFLCAEGSVPAAGHSELVLGTLPLSKETLAGMTEGLGKLLLFPGFTTAGGRAGNVEIRDADDPEPPATEGPTFASVQAGVLPGPEHLFDQPIWFTSPLTVVSWETGKAIPAMMLVTSRPTLLYRRLFASSTGTGVAVRAILFGLAIACALLEVFAVAMAIGLGRTITCAVADLYRGTREIDAGNLEHRIRVKHHDQLGALATSFNGMAASIKDLLGQQREKERLLNELAIAQEVQTTLLPHSPATAAGLEMHALSLPARTVGGDYFDFIFGPGSSLCLTLGDISGKGISAALLMASLHSAVRAYSLADRELAGGASYSPALLLRELNQHLYRSTQSARYATLFLASYDGDTSALTYCNGGHLPPVIVSLDGGLRRLDRGGAVVGLLDGMDYVQDTVQLATGDLLVVFTDGLTEPEREGDEFGEERLLETVRRYSHLPLPLIAENTLGAVRAWIGDEEQPDDMTILLARRL